MKIKNIQLNIADFAGIGTWALVFGLSLSLLVQLPVATQPNIYLVSFLFVSYIFGFVIITKHLLFAENRTFYLSLLSMMLVLVYWVMWLLPFSFLPILSIIWAAILPYYFSLRVSVFITFMVVSGSTALNALHWQHEGYLFQGALYFTFHLFSLFMMQNAKSAQDANGRSQQLNKELQATQQLLAEASRQNERTRIARDLHDLLGHHLTALIINLQVASHLTEGEAKVKVDQCYSLSKLLLSDVREAVNAIRENHQLNFRKMVDLMIVDIPKLKITSQINAELDLEDLDIAKALLSCIQEAITNSLRHSGASEFWITLKMKAHSDEPCIDLELLDNGVIQAVLTQDRIKLGNGLKGMRERIEELAGEVIFDQVKRGLRISIKVPLFGSNSKSKNIK